MSFLTLSDQMIHSVPQFVFKALSFPEIIVTIFRAQSKSFESSGKIPAYFSTFRFDWCNHYNKVIDVEENL